MDDWTPRDLPFLRVLHARLEADPDPDEPTTGRPVVADQGWTEAEGTRALKNLLRGGHVVELPTTARFGDGPLDAYLDVTEKALYAVEAWPSPETALDRMIRALDAIADNTDDEDTRSNARRTADWLRRSVNTVGLSVAGAVISGQL